MCPPFWTQVLLPPSLKLPNPPTLHLPLFLHPVKWLQRCCPFHSLTPDTPPHPPAGSPLPASAEVVCHPCSQEWGPSLGSVLGHRLGCGGCQYHVSATGDATFPSRTAFDRRHQRRATTLEQLSSTAKVLLCKEDDFSYKQRKHRGRVKEHWTQIFSIIECICLFVSPVTCLKNAQKC